MDLALDNLQKLICHKTQPTNQPVKVDMLLKRNKPHSNIVPI